MFGLMGSIFPPAPLPCSAIVTVSGHLKETSVLPWKLKPEKWAPTGVWENQLMLPDTSNKFFSGVLEKAQCQQLQTDLGVSEMYSNNEIHKQT